MRKRFGLWVLLISALGAPWPPVWAGSCMTADVPGPIRLPDGSGHPPGELTICTIRAYNPVLWIHRIYLDGAPAGMFISREVDAEGGADGESPFMVFRRDPAGQLALFGYTVAVGRKLVSYRLDERTFAPRGIGRGRAMTSWLEAAAR